VERLLKLNVKTPAQTSYVKA